MDKDLTPLGELLEAARLAQRPKLSQNELAKRASTSGTTYRRVIMGTSRFGGQDIAFGGSAETVARMAQVVGVTPEQLEEAGRADAAGELRALPGPPPTPSAPDDLEQRALELLAQAQEMLGEARRRRAENE